LGQGFLGEIIDSNNESYPIAPSKRNSSYDSREQESTSETSGEQQRTAENSREQQRTAENSRGQQRTAENSREQQRTAENSRERQRTAENSREQQSTAENSREQQTKNGSQIFCEPVVVGREVQCSNGSSDIPGTIEVASGASISGCPHIAWFVPQGLQYRRKW